MLKSLSVHNVLHEAAELLKIQGKHVEVNSNAKSASFEDLLNKKTELSESDDKKILENDFKNSIKESSPNDNFNSLDKNLSKQVNENNKNNKQKDFSNDINKNVSVKEKKKLNNIEIDSDKNINKNKKLKKAKEDFEINNNAALINTVPVAKIKFSDLNINDKEKIQDVLKKLSNGNINEKIANSAINQIINKSKINNTQEKNNKNIKVESKDNKSNFKLSNNFNLNNDKKTENKINPVSDNTNKENKNIFNNILKDNKNFKKLEAKEKDAPDNSLKNNKFEIVLNTNQTKNIDLSFRVKNFEPQKILEQNKEALFNNIAKNTKIVMSQGQTQFSTMIRPDNFGRIDFKFMIKDGKVNGKMIFQNQESADFFKANVQEIKAVFQKANVELENLDIILAGNKFADTADSQHENNKSFDNFNESSKKGFKTNGINSFDENISANNIQNYSKAMNSRVNLVI